MERKESAPSGNEPGAAGRPGFPLARVCFLFFAVMAVLHGILWLLAFQGIEPLSAQTAGVVSRLLSVAGIANTLADGTHILMRNTHWVITTECSAVNVHILFTSFILAFAATVRSKAVALAVGIPLICLLNFSRLLLLGVVTEFYPHYARFLHDYLWQVVFVVLVIAMWFVWIELVVKRETNS